MTGIEELEKLKWKVELQSTSANVSIELQLEQPNGDILRTPAGMCQYVALRTGMSYEIIWNIWKKLQKEHENFYTYIKISREDFMPSELKEEIQYFIEECTEFINDFENSIKYTWVDLDFVYKPLVIYRYNRKENRFVEDDNNE